MDDAARLVSELRDRLAELDGKVAAYQRDMLAEFHRHMDECLRNYPDHVSSEVSRTVAASVFAGNYPSLSPSHLRDASGPPLTRPPVSPAIINSTSRGTWGSPGGRKSPPPILRHTSGTPMEGSRSPHAREKEFQGLFTPTYLPLLENDSRRSSLHSPPMSPPPTSEGSPLPLSTDNVDKVNKALTAEAPKPPAITTSFDNRPVPVRRLTDRSEASSSLESYGSESNIATSKGRRRSALRRSSSSNKDSPRRVRFEFEGEEIFPASSSPRTPTAITFTDESGSEAQAATATVDEAEAESLEFATEQDEVDRQDRVQGNGDDESITYKGTSLLDVEGEEDALPKPRKVSSTQALQALTRSPLEEGTTWRVVNPDPEEAPPSMNGEKLPERPKGLTTRNDSQATIRPNGNGHKGIDRDARVSVDEAVEDVDDGALDDSEEDSEEGDEEEDEEEEDSASEDEFLSIPIRRKPTSPSDPNAQPAQPPNLTRPTPKAAEPAQPQESAGVDNGIDDDPFFEFDDEVGGPSSSSPQKHQKYLAESESSDEDPTPGRLRKAAREEQQRLQQQQAGGDTVSSPSGAANTSANTNTNSTNPMSPSSALFDHSIGSYMGRSMTVAPIKDAKLYDEIAGMRDVRFSVGSLKDVTGIEAAAMGSYRASAPSLARDSGFTPRSFSERLVLEDEMERRRVAGEGGDDEF